MLLRGPPGESVRAPGTHTVCQSWPENRDSQPAVAVRCHTPGGEWIECCGHGLLAAAHRWQRQLDRDHLTLLMNGSHVESWRHDACTWLRFASVATDTCPVPDWIAEIFPGQSPEAAATCGDARGYLVLQWPDNVDLSDLQTRIERVAACTGRALVCTAAQPQQGHGAIQLRYFAPQYGVEEDHATGSAMRVLAAYWSPRFVRLIARQCSPRGGELLSSWSPGHVDVGGRCREIGVVTNNA